MADLIAELRELCAIEGRPLTVGERARTKIAMSEAAAALEAAKQQRGRVVGSRTIDGVHVVVATAFTPGVEEQLLVRYDDYLAALEAAREDALALANVRKVVAEFEGMTGSGYRYMAANVRAAIDQARGKGGAA